MALFCLECIKEILICRKAINNMHLYALAFLISRDKGKLSIESELSTVKELSRQTNRHRQNKLTWQRVTQKIEGVSSITLYEFIFIYIYIFSVSFHIKEFFVTNGKLFVSRRCFMISLSLFI